MRCFCVMAVCLFSVASWTVAEEAKHGTKLDKGISIPANVGFVTDVSEDQQVATIIFSNVYAQVSGAVQGGRGALNQTKIETKVVTLDVPYGTDARSVKMFMDLRGVTSVDSGAGVRLVACAGDTTTVVKVNPTDTCQVKLKGKAKEAIAAEAGVSQFKDFEERITFTVQTHAKKPVLQITLFLVAEHDTDVANGGTALLGLDSIDLSIGEPNTAKISK